MRRGFKAFDILTGNCYLSFSFSFLRTNKTCNKNKLTWLHFHSACKELMSSSWVNGDSRGHKIGLTSSSHSCRRQVSKKYNNIPCSTCMASCHHSLFYYHHHHPFFPHPQCGNQSNMAQIDQHYQPNSINTTNSILYLLQVNSIPNNHPFKCLQWQ